MASDETNDVANELAQRAEDEQLVMMQEQARQQALRHERDNAAAERLRTFGEDAPKGKRASAEYLRGAETIAGPSGPTSSEFAGQTLDEQEGEDVGEPGDR
jgi:hypothetical protein